MDLFPSLQIWSFIFKKIYNVIQTQFDKNIKVLQSDSGGEYIFGDFYFFLFDKGIIHKTMPPIPYNKME